MFLLFLGLKHHYNPTEYKCKGDGLYADYVRGCHVYYNCKDGQKEM